MSRVADTQDIVDMGKGVRNPYLKYSFDRFNGETEYILQIDEAV